mmetsp:Transcript_30898/g.51149  ORF Transcript_30898/g.51149 Transcript_30898/m.51149 type:complete len:202 (-) Transcript_30898:78-683(-)
MAEPSGLRPLPSGFSARGLRSTLAFLAERPADGEAEPNNAVCERLRPDARMVSAAFTVFALPLPRLAAAFCLGDGDMDLKLIGESCCFGSTASCCVCQAAVSSSFGDFFEDGDNAISAAAISTLRRCAAFKGVVSSSSAFSRCNSFTTDLLFSFFSRSPVNFDGLALMHISSASAASSKASVVTSFASASHRKVASSRDTS